MTHELKIDFSTISFPSDKLTIRTIRALFPDRNAFAEHDLKQLPQIDAKIGGLWETFNLERRFAKYAFQKALTGRDNWEVPLNGRRHSCAEELARHYAALGIASGRVEIFRLIEEIEKQAAAQGLQLAPRSTGQAR
jgi:hypothetical protein